MKKKKGFTLVELLVVIAILAVLATVSVVGYMGFTKKAQESNDIGLTTQMNTILQAEEVTNKPSTPHEAVKQLADGGVDVEKLTPRTDGYNYVYDLDTNRIFLLNTDKQPVAPTNINFTKENRIFAIVGNETEYNTWKEYNVYLKTDFEMKSTNLFADLKTGLDVGSNKIDNITYTGSNKKEALIRTNGGTLTINAGADTVYHYGASNIVDIQDIANDSFHENGSVARVNVTKGHYVSEKGSNVIDVHVVSNDAIISEKDGATVLAYTKEDSVTEVKVNDTKVETTETPIDAKDVTAEGGVAEINGVQFTSLQAALNTTVNGSRIIVLDDIDLNKTLSFENDVNATLDLNGKTIYNSKDLWVGNDWSLISVKNGNLTITGNGKLSAKADDCYAVDLQDGGKCTIENGTILGNMHAVYVLEGELTVKGGTYMITQQYPDSGKEYQFVLNCLDASYKNKTAKIFVSGGLFEDFIPSDCYAEGKGTNFCVDGYGVKQDSNDEYIVSEIRDISGTSHKFYSVEKIN